MDFVGRKAPAAKPDDFARTAATIGCEVAAFRAVIAVETGGRGFDATGRLKALFEPHIFYRLLGEDNRRAAVRAGLAYRSWGTRPYPKDSYPRIMAALCIDEERALQATSWGMPQILGVNHKAAGYDSACAMVDAFLAGEAEHLAAMARFIVSNKLDAALKRRDWAAFARGYNGARFAVNSYDKKLAQAYAHFRLERPMAVMIAPLPSPVTTSSEPVVRSSPTIFTRVASFFGR
jgi:hypothetical protein